MPKYKIKKKECQLLVNVKLTSSEKINEIEMDAFSRVYIRGFLKGRVIRKFGKNTIEYMGPIGISLHEYLKNPLEKTDFLFMMEQIVDMNQKINANGLNAESVIWDINYIFINEATRELQFIYLPLEQNRQTVDVPMLVDHILYSVKPVQGHDRNYISEFAYFLKGMGRFDLNKIEYFIMEQDSSIVKTIKKHGAGQSGYITDKRAEYLMHYRDDGDERTTLLEDEEATGLLDDDKTTLLMQDDGDSETTLLMQDDGDSETTLLVQDDGDSETTLLVQDDDETTLLAETNQVQYPYLIRESNGEKIEINKQVFRIGKERSYVEYFVADNNAVSRSHADIITRGSQYYVKDLNSKNRTFINNHAIPVEQEMGLLDGDQLCLANENFTFYTN